MKTQFQFARPGATGFASASVVGSQAVRPRSGVAMIIVLSLMGALAFLGFFFFSYTISELDSATWFFQKSQDPITRSNSNPQLSSSQTPSDIYFDWALEQAVVGTRRELTNSALYGNKYSLMANMLGQIDGDLTVTDLHPYNGSGIKVLFTDADDDGIPDLDTFDLDYDGDGIGETFFVLNHSAGAHTANAQLDYSGQSLPGYQPLGTSALNDEWIPYSQMRPDVDYTYPDINNLSLSQLTWIPNSGSSSSFTPVWTPSFHRPQYLNRTTGSNPWNSTSGSLPARALRPHNEQKASRWTGSVVETNPANRFDSTDFTFSQPTEGIWRASGPPFNISTFDATTYNYDIDADGDGVKEAIYLDLDFPPTPWIDTLDATGDGQGRKFFIPLFGMTILDADGLINLNASGNLNHAIDDIVDHFDSAKTIGEMLQDTARDGIVTLSPTDPPHFFSASNQGYSTFETNAARALYANATTLTPAQKTELLAPYIAMFDNPSAPTIPTAVTQLETANYDLFRLIAGAAEQYTSAGDLLSNRGIFGRAGEAGFLVDDLQVTGAIADPYPTNPAQFRSIIFGRPGVGRTQPTTTYVPNDDDADGTLLDPNAGAGMPRDAVTVSYAGIDITMNYPPSVHPVDVRGTGGILDVDYPNFATSGAARRLLEDTAVPNGTPLTPNPSVWPYYKGQWQTLGTTGYLGVTPYSAINATVDVMENPTSLLFNEDDELILEPDFADFSNDSIFPTSEMESLHLSDSDFRTVALGKQSSLRELAPFNFRDHTDARFIRKQFTTDSWARREFSFLPLPATLYDDDGNAVTPDVTWIDRSWEYNDDVSNAPNFAFPPRFGTVTPYTDPEDPFRPALRGLLTNILNNTSLPSTTRFQRKLLLGQLVQQVGSELSMRPLTPHPVISGSITALPIMLHDESDPGFAPDDGEREQEFWARYDRQRLARDIYVLLYTLGGPDDLNPTANSYADSTQVERMAQFAVNLVDAMDEDHHITRFAYDPDLSVDGWDTDDANLEVVYGVEEQRLAISEGMWISARRNTGVDTMPWNDDAEVTLHEEYDGSNELFNQYLFLELRNTSPLSVPLNSNTYRVVRVSHDTDGDLQTQVKAISFLDACPDVDPGENFRIGTHSGDLLADDNAPQESVFRCKLDWNGNGVKDPEDDTFRPIVPAFTDAAFTNATPVATPFNDLDLCHDDHRVTTPYFSESSQALGYFLLDDTNANLIDDLIEPNIVISLQRRMNVDANANLTDTDNPWLEVDRIEIPVSDFQLLRTNFSNTIADIQAVLNTTPASPAAATAVSGLLADNGFASTVRGDRFGRFYQFTDTNNTVRNRLYHHSMGEHFPEGISNGGAEFGHPQEYTFSALNRDSHNLDSNEIFKTWQPHFDRTHTSVVEFFSTPIVGSTRLLNSDQLASSNVPFTPKALAPGQDPVNQMLGKMSDTYTAGHWFLNPQGDLAAELPANPNRWYRILEFFEVEPQIHKDLANRGLLQSPRTPGKINLNTIRATQPNNISPGPHPQAGYLASLAALIDDETHLGLDFNLVDQLEDGSLTTYTRNWRDQFLVARDGIDPLTQLPLPGGIGSRPFRSLSFLDTNPSVAGNADRSLQHTILRDLPFDPVLFAESSMDENNEPLPENRRQLFEARTFADADPSNPLDNVDYHTRHRLLSKIHNNSTTISNVFYIFVAVEFFEAEETTTGSGFWQIGRKLTSADDPQFKLRRGFFVVDRSLLEKAYDPTTGRVDFRKLILHRRKLEPYN